MEQAAILNTVPEDEYYFQEGCHILELSNGEYDPALSIARARVAPGVSTRWHSLRGTCERYVILQGIGRAEVGDTAAQEITMGDVVLIPPEMRQRITNVGSQDLVFLAICTPRFTVDCYVDLENQSGQI